MKRILKLCCVCISLRVSRAHFSANRLNGGALDAIHPSVEIRDLGTGGIGIMKKPKIESKKDKISKSDSKDIKNSKRGKGKGNDQGKGMGNGDDNESDKKGKGMTNMKGMMDKVKGKTAAPIVVETATPSTTPTPVAITSTPVASIPTESPKTNTPFGLETETPIASFAPSPGARDTEAPSVTPSATTTAPMVLEPSAQPILVSPTNFEFISTSNILVRYESLDSGAGVSLNQTMEAIDLTCEYIRNEGIVPLGALEFACIWFLPMFDENGLIFFPLNITYAGTAAFPSNVANITTEILDASIISVMTPPMVGNLTEMFGTELPSENPFSQTEEIYAVL